MQLTSTTDRQTGRKMLMGPATSADLMNDTAFSWFKEKYDAYVPESAAVSQIKNNNVGLSFVVFAGTWCPDTRALLPGFYKTITEAGISESNIHLHLLNRSKQSGEGLTDNYKIEYLPTFIVMKDGKEVGRVVETINKSIEGDISEILRK